MLAEASFFRRGRQGTLVVADDEDGEQFHTEAPQQSHLFTLTGAASRGV